MFGHLFGKSEPKKTLGLNFEDYRLLKNLVQDAVATAELQSMIKFKTEGRAMAPMEKKSIAILLLKEASFSFKINTDPIVLDMLIESSVFDLNIARTSVGDNMMADD